MYHESGVKMYEGNFEYGKESGREVVFYDAGGNISFIGDVATGIILGYMEAFNKIKRLIHSGQYDDIGRESLMGDVPDLNKISERKPQRVKSDRGSGKNGICSRMCAGSREDLVSTASSNAPPKKCNIF
jgi:antitoxin component YwqK of YwqJK toxin-antitoxin module